MAQNMLVSVLFLLLASGEGASLPQRNQEKSAIQSATVPQEEVQVQAAFTEKEATPCPATHPYAFGSPQSDSKWKYHLTDDKFGQLFMKQPSNAWCCATDKEDDTSRKTDFLLDLNSKGGCDGSWLNAESRCCENWAHAPCPEPPCSNYQGSCVGRVGSDRKLFTRCDGCLLLGRCTRDAQTQERCEARTGVWCGQKKFTGEPPMLGIGFKRGESFIQNDGSIRPRDYGGDDGKTCIYYRGDLCVHENVTGLGTKINGLTKKDCQDRNKKRQVHNLRVGSCADLVVDGRFDETENTAITWEYNTKQNPNKISSYQHKKFCWSIAPNLRDPGLFLVKKLYFGVDNSRAKITLADCVDAQEFSARAIVDDNTPIGWRVGYTGDGVDDVKGGREYCIEAASPQNEALQQDAFLYFSRCGQDGYSFAMDGYGTYGSPGSPAKSHDYRIRLNNNDDCVYYPTAPENDALVQQVKKESLDSISETLDCYWQWLLGKEDWKEECSQEEQIEVEKKEDSTSEFPLTTKQIADTWLKTINCSLLNWKDNKIVRWEWHGYKIRSVDYPSHCWGLVKNLDHWKLWAMTPGNRSKFIMVPCSSPDAAEFTVASGIHGEQLRIETQGNRPFCVQNMLLPQNKDVLQQADRYLFMGRCTTGLL